MSKRKPVRPRLVAVTAMSLLVLVPGVALGGYSADEPPSESVLDPGDLFVPGLAGPLCEVDDGDGTCPPPSLNVPDPSAFDLDAFSINAPLEVCPHVSWPAGILFSFNDGDPGAGSGAPDHATEILFYDHCLNQGNIRQSYYTSITETALGLGSDPPPRRNDDDVDAYETRTVQPYWDRGDDLLFSPDSPSTGGFGPGSEGNVYSINRFMAVPQIWATPAQLGVPDPTSCNIDGIAPLYDPSNPSWLLLFTTHLGESCGLDPGDIYVSDLHGRYWLYADDVNDLKIASSESDPVDIDALAINTGGGFQITGPYAPPDTTTYKADWPNYAPSGMPDLEQDHQGWPPTWCGPTAVADSFWWFDSEMECDRQRTKGDPSETEPNDTCTQADALGEVPPVPGSLISPSEDQDWYTFEVPSAVAGARCVVTVSTCALRKPGDADTRIDLYDGCGPTGIPGNLIAQNDNACPPDLQSEVTVKVEIGRKYFVRVSGFGDAYTLSLGIDCHRLVERYPAPVFTPDDHSNHNPEPLIEDLSWCMNTDDQQGTGSGHRGTRVGEMQSCIQSWIVTKSLHTTYSEQTVIAPAFDVVASGIERSHDAVLLLGFYWQDPAGDVWTRCAGHYVTAAGVDSPLRTITVSDPALNNAEPPPAGNGAPGRVRGPDHTDHAPGVTPPPDHDDVQNVSHDRYAVGASVLGPPVSQWSLPAYATAGSPTTCGDVRRFCMGSEYGQNPAPVTGGIPDQPCPDPAFPVSAEVEAMVEVAPQQTAICLSLVNVGPWPNNLRVNKGRCVNPGVSPILHDVIRGKLCNLKLANLIPQVDLGYVQCLHDDSALDRFDEVSPDDSGCFGGWFYLVRQIDEADYGASSGGFPRVPSLGGCP